MIRYAVLGSGSSGNAIYFNVDGCQFLVDCGFSQRELGKRLSVFGKTVSDISAVFITHDHGDHKAAWLAKNSMAGWEDYQKAATHIPFIARFPLQHDSESFGYVIGDNSGNRVAVIGDTGCVPEEVLPYLFGCQAILIECNYDVELLVNGPYSTEQQERIASDHGHLMNEDAAAVVECVAWEGLRHVCALHLSERNNRPEYVRQALENAVRGVEGGCEVEISSQKVPGKMVVLM
jgi:phosphoribosyl 1,2-cyclic phosphodiesterase